MKLLCQGWKEYYLVSRVEYLNKKIGKVDDSLNISI